MSEDARRAAERELRKSVAEFFAEITRLDASCADATCGCDGIAAIALADVETTATLREVMRPHRVVLASARRRLQVFASALSRLEKLAKEES